MGTLTLAGVLQGARMTFQSLTEGWTSCWNVHRRNSYCDSLLEMIGYGRVSQRRKARTSNLALVSKVIYGIRRSTGVRGRGVWTAPFSVRMMMMMMVNNK